MSNYQSSEGFTKTYTTKSAVIASGQSLSAAIDLEQLNIATILFPASWDAADITFQTSPDGVTYGDLIDDKDAEVKRTPVAGKAMGINIPELSGVRFLKIRSGTSASPVNQTADRTLVLTLTNNPETPAPSTGGGASTIADGANVVEGLTTDAAVISDANGTISGKLRGLVKIFADVWSSTLHTLGISQSAAIVPSATTMQSAVSANANGTSLNVQGYATTIINITSSPSMSGGTIVNFEASTDDSEWQPILAHQIGVQGNQVLTTSTDGDYRINCAGFKSIRARISGYSAGTVTIKGYVTPLSASATTVGISGSSDTAQTDSTQTTSIGSFIKGLVKILADVWDSSLHGLKVVQATAGNLNAVVFGYDGSTNRALSTNTDGSLKVTGNYIAITATIANGASLSGEIDLGSRQLAAIFMPSSWTAANLTFQASDQTGGTFQDVYDSAGNELTAIAAASRTITDIPELGPLRFIKVRSGTSGTPVNQGGARTIILLVK